MDARKSIELNPDDRWGFIGQLLRSYLSLEREDEVRATIDELAPGRRLVRCRGESVGILQTIADYYRHR